MEKKIKDLILVTAHCDTDEKKETIKKLLLFLNQYSNKFDIMCVSHTVLDISLQEKCDYYIFDKENLLLYDDEIRPKVFHRTNEFTITSNYHSLFSTSYAVLKLVSMGVTLAKSLGYEKVHKIEYDTTLTSISEFMDNSKLLDNNDIVCYTNNGDKNAFMSGSIWSSNVDKLPKFYYNYNRDDILNMLYCNSDLSPEWIVKKHFDTKKCIYKNTKKLKEIGFSIGMSSKNKNYRYNLFFPFFNGKNNKLCFFSKNTRSEKIKIGVLYGDDYFDFLLDSGVWNIRDINFFNDKKILSVWIDDSHIYDIDFSKINIDKFKQYNNINYK
jgi:hypothetical protein